MRLAIACAALSLASATATSSAAADLLTELYGAPNSDPNNITLRSEVAPLFRGDRLFGCSVNFQVIQREVAYRRGEPVLLDGSIGLLYDERRAIVGTMKLGVGSISSEGKVVRVAPAEAAIIGERTNSSAAEVFASEETEPGFRFIILDLNKTKASAFVEALATAQAFQRIDGYYTLAKGGLGSNFYVDLRVRAFQPSQVGSLQLTADAGARLKSCTEDLFSLAIADGDATQRRGGTLR